MGSSQMTGEYHTWKYAQLHVKTGSTLLGFGKIKTMRHKFSFIKLTV